MRFIDLPARTAARFELAVNGPQELLRARGWSPVDAMRVSRTADAYRDYIQGSKAEFGVAKHAYVAHRSGWFSDRTACYLAAGRPAVVQDTGVERPPAVGNRPDPVLHRGGGARGSRADRKRLRSARRAGGRDRAGVLRRRARAAPAAGHGGRVMPDERHQMRIALVAPVAQSGAAATVRLDRDGNRPAGQGPGRARPRSDPVRGGIVEDAGDPARRFPARLPRRRVALAVGAVRAVQPGRGGRARPGLRRHPRPGRGTRRWGWAMRACPRRRSSIPSTTGRRTRRSPSGRAIRRRRSSPSRPPKRTGSRG